MISRRVLLAVAMTLASAPGCSLDWSKKGSLDADSGTRSSENSAKAPPDGGPFESDSGRRDSHPDAGHGCHADSDCSSSEICTAMQCVPRVECDSEHACKTSDFRCESGHCVFIPPPRIPSGIFQSNGGGQTSSAEHVLRLSVGTPQPMGITSSGEHQLTVGPGAGRP
jgi:hypothetical protein